MSDIDSILCVCVDRVLEQMFFETAIPSETVPTGETLSACVAFDGEASGRLEVLAGVSLARELAASFLGEDPDALEMERDVYPVVVEMANMIGGTFLSQWRPDLRFHILPVAPAQRDVPAWQNFAVAGGILSTSLVIN